MILYNNKVGNSVVLIVFLRNIKFDDSDWTMYSCSINRNKKIRKIMQEENGSYLLGAPSRSTAVVIAIAVDALFTMESREARGRDGERRKYQEERVRKVESCCWAAHPPEISLLVGLRSQQKTCSRIFLLGLLVAGCSRVTRG